MQKIILCLGAFLGFLSVVIGAFGAHAFKDYLQATQRTETFETAVKYQFYHALGLVLVGLLMFHLPSKFLTWAGIFMVLGVLFFSGSLYLLCATNQKYWGAVAPIGGLLMIISWLSICWAVLRA